MSGSRRSPCRPGVRPRSLDHPLPALSLIVDLLDEAVQAADTDRSILVRIRCPGDTVEIGLRPLDPGMHPIDALLGFRAPPDWAAIGVISPGRAHDLDGTVATFPIGLIHLVDRSGASVSRIQSPADTNLSSPVGSAEGLLADCCRRTLGLSTPPPPPDALAWWATIWLERVLVATLAEPGRHWCWRDLARAHPLVSRGAVPAQPTALAARVRKVAATTGWPELRAAAATGSRSAPFSPAICAWMDDGLFARWTLEELPNQRDLLDELREVLPAEHLAALAAAVDAWDQQ